MKRVWIVFALLVGWLNLLGSGNPIGSVNVDGTEQQATATPYSGVVRAVLFYSPRCEHCQYVFRNVLPPLFQKYGGQLQIAGVDVTRPQGQAIYREARAQYATAQAGVPMLVIGELALVGSEDIPQLFPGLIEQYMALGGIDWPPILGLEEVLPTPLLAPRPSRTPQPSPTLAPTQTIARIDLVARIRTLTAAVPTPFPTRTVVPTATSTLPAKPSPTPPAAINTAAAIAAAPPPAAATPTGVLLLVIPEEDQGIWELVSRDPSGNGLAIAILAGMILSLIVVTYSLSKPPGKPRSRWIDWLIPLACLAGLGVAGYLAFVETAQTSAICGPLGDCNAVQQSEYARLFGLLPVGVLGVLGYAAMLIAWIVGQLRAERLAALANLALFGMAFAGTLFSLYLTFLEPFVIGATCAWCLASAVLMTFLLWLSAAPARRAIGLFVNVGVRS
jgi:uncharacterized membrane protein